MASPDTSVLLQIHRRAELIRQCDDRFVALLTAGEIAITYYSPRGQEVVSAATSVHLEPRDYVVTTYRGLHDHVAKGVPLRALWAEFLGKAAGTCKGKGGPMHITHPGSGLMVTTGVVGAGLPIAVGLALSAQMRGEPRVTVCSFGDGASNIGAFHEALNLASLWSLPVVFLCQNNRWGEKTAFVDHTRVARVSDRAASYAMPGQTVDGNDAEAMWDAAGVAIDRARRGDGPTLLEAMTFRFRGHYFGDDSSYIPAAEMEEARQRDPLPRLRGLLVRRGVSEDELATIDKEIAAAVDDAAVFAMQSEYPDVVENRRDVFDVEVGA